MVGGDEEKLLILTKVGMGLRSKNMYDFRRVVCPEEVCRLELAIVNEVICITANSFNL